jgi:anti-repressor protein
MNNSLVKPFDFKGTPVRTLTYETGQTWWVLADVCNALGLSNPSRVAQRLDEGDVSQADISPNSELGHGFNTVVNIVNESGLYEVIFRSDKQEAKEFRHWVTSDVLPTIRRTGSYGNPQDKKALLAAAFIEAKSIIEDQEKQLAAQAPKVLFADAVSASDSKILIGEMAKILKQNGVENMGANRFFQWLRDNGYLIRRQGRDYNSPTQRAQEMGLFFVKETSITHSSGFISVNKTTLVTGKGQQYFINKFLGMKDLVLA